MAPLLDPSGDVLWDCRVSHQMWALTRSTDPTQIPPVLLTVLCACASCVVLAHM